jgi:general secretion pathway protein C
MELRFSERYLMAINVILVALLAYFAALLVDDVVARKFAPPLDSLMPAAVAPPSAPQVFPRSHYEQIVSRDIFNLIPQVVAPVRPVVVARNLHVRLLGTSLVAGHQAFAVIEDQQTGRQMLYHLGEMIPDTGRLVKIERTSIVIDEGGQLATLSMQEQKLTPGTRTRFQRPRYGQVYHQGIRRVGANRYVVARATVDSNLQNMAQLFTQIRAVPNLQDGHSTGFTLSDIQPGSIFQAIGLHDGDVLTSVNGQDVSDPTRAIQLLGQLRESPSISLQVMRNGRPVELNYAIR